jgi:hypothetical protein
MLFNLDQEGSQTQFINQYNRTKGHIIQNEIASRVLTVFKRSGKIIIRMEIGLIKRKAKKRKSTKEIDIDEVICKCH